MRLDDRASFRRFCGFARSEPTPERTAFVRFRRELLRHGLDQVLFEEITAQLKARAIRVKTGTLVDATVVGSASEGDGEARWSGHRSRKSIHGYKAHVGADADTALVEEVAVTPGNAHDGRNGEAALPDNPGDVFADSAYRGSVFRDAVRARAAQRVSPSPMSGPRARRRLIKNLSLGTARSTRSAAASRKSSAPGNALTAFAACDGEASPKPISKPA